jgi:fumarate hydratase class II
MPGKVNPVICEAVMMVAAQVIGYDTTISLCGMLGNFELNVMMPVLAYDLLEGIRLLASASRVFTDKCIVGITANVERCQETLDRNLSTVTALVPRIGYDKAAEIAKAAYASNRTIREIAREWKVLGEEELDALLDYRKMTEPGDLGQAGG